MQSILFINILDRKNNITTIFRNSYIHEGNEVKFTTDNKSEVITTLKMKKGWVYIKYKKYFIPV